MANTKTSLNKVKTRFILPYDSANTDKESSKSELSRKITPSHQPTAYSGRQMDKCWEVILITRQVHGGSNRGLSAKMKCLEGGQKPSGNAICCSQMEWQKFGKQEDISSIMLRWRNQHPCRTWNKPVVTDILLVMMVTESEEGKETSIKSRTLSRC